MWASRSLVISTRFLKSSGRTSFAIAAKSSGFLMSCLGKGIPPLGHSTMAFWTASSSVRAQETWICSSLGEVVTSLPASFAPSSYLSQSIAIFSSAAPTVMIPSANLPVFLALIGPAVAT